MVTALEFAAAAESLRGTPFHHHGRTRAGLDCAGIVFLAAELCGLFVEPFLDYQPTPDPEVVLRIASDRCAPRDWAEWRQPGRVLVMRQRPESPPRHFAITLGDGRAIHQESRARVLALDDRPALIHSVHLLRGVAA